MSSRVGPHIYVDAADFGRVNIRVELGAEDDRTVAAVLLNGSQVGELIIAMVEEQRASMSRLSDSPVTGSVLDVIVQQWVNLGMSGSMLAGLFRHFEQEAARAIAKVVAEYKDRAR